MKDLIIIGAGPAGMTAAIYAARKKLDFTIVSINVGGQMAWSGSIENYPAYHFIVGPELAKKFEDHMEEYKIDFKEGLDIKKVEKNGADFKVITSTGEEMQARTIIVASGKKPRLLGVPGEGKFNRKGIAYCATCDGPLFTGKEVAVVGGGNSGLDAVLQMIRLCPKVYLIEAGPELKGDKILQEKVKASDKVEILINTKVKEAFGDKFLDGIKVDTAGKERALAVKGVFVEIGLLPNSDIIDFVKKNEHNEIIINCACETSVPGLFAAGDVSSVPDKQIVIASGEGAKAALSAFSYVLRH